MNCVQPLTEQRPELVRAKRLCLFGRRREEMKRFNELLVQIQKLRYSPRARAHCLVNDPGDIFEVDRTPLQIVAVDRAQHFFRGGRGCGVWRKVLFHVA